MIQHFKIWAKVAVKNTSLKSIVVTLLEHLLYLGAIFLLTNYNLLLSFTLLIVLMMIRSAVRLFVFYKGLLHTNSYNSILLKPVDPLYGLFIYKRNITDILALIPVLLFLKFRKKVNEK